MEISRDLFKRQRHRRFGGANPERMRIDFWEWMIRGDENAVADPDASDDEETFSTGYSPYQARILFKHEGDYSGGPIWTFERMGAARTALPDGKLICIGGEHEDHYDPDFCIYNDVIAIGPDRSIEIYGYPKDLFPPTDFHTATLVGDRIIVIGRIGYHGERMLGTTPVYAINLADYRIEELPSHGELPGWIFKHEASAGADGVITIRGGEIEEAKGDDSRIRRNFDDFALHLHTGRWERLTTRNWRQFSIRDEDGMIFQIGDPRAFEYIQSLVKEKYPDTPSAFVNLTLEAILPQHTAYEIESEDVWSGARIVVAEIPVSVKAECFTIEIIIEGDMEEELANGLAEDIRANIEAHTGRRCILDPNG